MRDVLRHRGPDAEGLWVAPDHSMALAHRRLKIIDLERGAQPMAGQSSQVWIVYNGEIYNYRELRTELQAQGRRFHTASDTEVLLAAYETWGPECVGRLNGIFAFLVWDSVAGHLFAARDPLGVKPLYYGWWDGRFYAASEAKAIVADPRVPRRVDPEALDLFFHEGYVPAPLAIWDGMRKLAAGHALTVPLRTPWAGLPEPEPYYSLPFARVQPVTSDETEVLEILDQHLRTAVRRQMVSDVPLGAFLSGGIDSSLLVSYLAEHADGPVETYSVSFRDDPNDEAPYAEAISRKYGTRHRRIVMGEDGLADLGPLAWAHDEPFGDPATVPTAVLSAAARERLTVVLSGDGGDETHAGYPRYRRMAQMACLDSIPSRLRRTLLGPAARIAPSYRRRGFLEQLVRGAADRYDAMTRQVPPHHRRSFYASRFIELLRDVEPGLEEGARPWRRDTFDGAEQKMLDVVQRVDLLTYLPEQLLPKVDRATMSVGLEARVPYLDLDAVAFAARIPVKLRMKNGTPKYLLRRLLAHRMGDEFVQRRKQGFTVPTKQWIASQPRAELKAALFPPGAEDWIDPDQVDNHVLGTARGLSLVWPLLAFAHWVRAFQPTRLT